MQPVEPLPAAVTEALVLSVKGQLAARAYGIRAEAAEKMNFSNRHGLPETFSSWIHIAEPAVSLM